MTLALASPVDAMNLEARRLRVALRTQGGATDWDFDWSDPTLGDLGERLRVDSVELGINEHFHRARITVNPAGEWSGESGTELTPPLRMARVPEIISPGRRICVYAETPDNLPGGGSASRSFLFDGYAPVIRLGFTEAELAYQLLTTSLLERADADWRAWCTGRYVVCPEDDDGSTMREVRAMRAVFNYKGRPNRHADLQTLWVAAALGGTYENMPAFTYDGDPDAVYWTLADVLVYLLVCHGQPAYALGMRGDDGIAGNGLELAGPIVEANEGPQDLDDPNTATFIDVLKTRCPELAIHSLPFTRQLLVWARAGGFCFSQITHNSDGEPDTGLAFWLRGDGGPYTDRGSNSADRTLRVAADDEIAAVRSIGLPAEDAVLDTDARKAEAARAEMVFDATTVVTTVVQAGDPYLYEVTLGRNCGAANADAFRPGWPPDTMFGDNLTGSPMNDKIDDIEDATSPDSDGDPGTMYNRYDRNGVSNFQYLDVGRLWVLNESGEYDGATYGRTNGDGSIWNEASYGTPYNFHTLASCPQVAENDWVARRRAIQELLSVPASGENRKPRLECSYDSGGHWYPLTQFECVGRSKPYEAQIAVRLTAPNLGLITNDKPSGGDSTADRSVWEAIVRGTFRLSLTCTIAGDDAILKWAGGGHGWADYRQTVVRQAAPGELRREQRANSKLKGDGQWTFSEVDDRDRAETLANTAIANGRARLVSGNIVIGWLTNDWLPGDLCSGLEKRGVSFKATTKDVRYPEVIRTLLAAGPNGQSTHITLDDRRTVARGV